MPTSEQANGTLHALSLTVMIAVSGALAGGIYMQSQWAKDKGKNGPDIDNMEAVEASLAYKKPDQKQPQKPKVAPPPDVKPEGVSHDENKTRDEKKKPEEPVKKPDEPADPLSKYKRHDTDEDEDTGKPTEPDQGAFDGSEFGFATETKGDPYFQDLIADLVKGWEYP